MAGKTVRVGNAGGYWGDDPGAMRRQLELGPLDYVTQDFLAEITMSILQKQRSRNPDLGYAVDFVDQVRQCIPLLVETGTRVISNAGGINPAGCAEQVGAAARKQGQELKIAVVEGDDLMDRLDSLLEEGLPLANMETGQHLSEVRDRVVSANAYLGVGPVIEALSTDSQIIITGRVTDTGIACAPPAFEFGWPLNDWDRLAAGVVAGHILECGAQATGGNLTDWREVRSFHHMAFPIAEFEADGSFVVGKHPETGGMVNVKTVTAQLVYEMGDPRLYVTPDVIANFSSIRLEPAGGDRVRIQGFRGEPRPQQLKVSIAYLNGFKAHGTIIVCQPDAVEKSHRMAETLWENLEFEFEETSTELVGYDACHRHISRNTHPGEILLRLGVRDPDRDKVSEFSKLFPSLILSSVPGVAIVGARPRIQTVVAYWPCLIPREYVTPRVSVVGTQQVFQVSDQVPETPLQKSPNPAARAKQEPESSAVPYQEQTTRCRLVELCWGRSGDKGDTANIGVVARSPEIYHWLCAYLTSDRVKGYFSDICKGPVERFEVPNLQSLNFLLHESLGGGGTVSLRIDPQGKTLADALLAMEVVVSQDLLSTSSTG